MDRLKNNIIFMYCALMLIFTGCDSKKNRTRVYNEMSLDRQKWHKVGHHSNYRFIGVPPNEAAIESISNTQDTWTSYMINIDPKKYLGRGLLLEMEVKAEDVLSVTNMFLKADSENESGIKFNEMKKKITGSTPYSIYSISIDVPMETTNIAYGVVLAGQGKVSFKNIKVKLFD